MTLQEEVPKYIPCTCEEIYKSRGLEAPDCPYHNYSDDIERLARLYAEAKCKEQRELCAECAEPDSSFLTGVNTRKIREAPAPKMD